jgi:hypothetical protein
MKNVAKKGPINAFIISLSSFFITWQIYLITAMRAGNKLYIALINKPLSIHRLNEYLSFHLRKAISN